MPIFEFLCPQCARKFAQLVGVTADSSEPTCPECGSRDVTKLVSRFFRLRGEDEVLNDLEDTALSTDMDDPGSVRRWMREMGRQLDEDGDVDFDEFMEEAERETVDDGDEAGDQE